MIKTLVIDGKRIRDISSFYEEINRIFMPNEDWQLGESLDALNDLFYGGFGAMKGNEPIHLIWKDFEKNKQDLGKEETKAYYRQKLNSPALYNIPYIQQKLNELENGTGPTYFDIILEIITTHPNIRLIQN